MGTSSVQTGQIASSLSPSFKMVSKYFISSVAAFVILNLLLTLNYSSISGHYFQPKILALVHITTLGWITMIIFGAMFQLVPVVLEVKLFSEILGEIQFWIFLTGVIGLVTGFWQFDIGNHLMYSAILLVLAMLLFIFNIGVSMLKVKKWNITGVYLIAALFYLLSTAAAGLLMAINLGHPFIQGNHLQYLKLHADVAMIGWVFMVIMGVSYKLIPMFTLSHGYSQRSAVLAFILINAGLLGITTVMHYTQQNWIYYFFILLIVLGSLLYLYQIVLIFGKRLRKKFDTGMKHSAVSFSILLLVIILGGVLSFVKFGNPMFELRLDLVYGYSILIGFFSMLTVGQMYKILPFLVWYHKYSSKVGLEPVPLLKDMFSEKSANAEFFLMIISIALGITGLLLDVPVILLFSFSIMLAASLIFAYNTFSIYRS